MEQRIKSRVPSILFFHLHLHLLPISTILRLAVGIRFPPHPEMRVGVRGPEERSEIGREMGGAREERGQCCTVRGGACLERYDHFGFVDRVGGDRRKEDGGEGGWRVR